jgi:hypothetical protein
MSCTELVLSCQNETSSCNCKFIRVSYPAIVLRYHSCQLNPSCILSLKTGWTSITQSTFLCSCKHLQPQFTFIQFSIFTETLTSPPPSATSHSFNTKRSTYKTSSLGQELSYISTNGHISPQIFTPHLFMMTESTSSC